MCANGRNLFASTLLATILGGGAWVLWIMSLVIGYSLTSFLWTNAPPQRSLSFTIEGQPIITSRMPPAYLLPEYRTLDGTLIEDPAKLTMHDGSYRNTDLEGPLAWRGERAQWSARIRGWAVTRPALMNWYLVQDNNPLSHAYLEGYDVATKQRVGFLGRSGFQASRPLGDEQFQIERFWSGQGGVFAPSYGASYGTEPYFGSKSQNTLMLVSEGALYRIDLRRQGAEPLAMPAKVISVGTFMEPKAVSDEREAVFQQRFVARLADRLLVLDDGGQTLTELTIPQKLRDYNLTLFDTTGDEWLLVRNAHSAWGTPTDVYWITPAGEITRQAQVDLSAPQNEPGAIESLAAAALFPMPFPFAVGVSAMQPLSLQRTARLKMGMVEGASVPDFATALAESLRRSWPALVVLCLVSAAMAAWCYRHQRRAVGAHAGYWAGFVFLFGLPGLVGYWLHRRWPTYERCEACHREVPRERDACLACEAPFPEPALRGVEIFG